MATIAGTITAAGASPVLSLGAAAEEVTYALTGPFDATLQLERATSPAGLAWEVVAGPFAGAASAAGRCRARPNDRLRLRARDIPANAATALTEEAAWTAGAGWALADGVATRSAGAATPNLDHSVGGGLVAGASYVVTFAMTTAAGSLTVSLGGGDASAALSEADGTVSVTLVAGASAVLRFIAAADFAGTVTAVTVTPSIAYSFGDGAAMLRELKTADGRVVETVTEDAHAFAGAVAIGGALTLQGTPIGADPDELNDADISARTQDLGAAGAINLVARHVRLTGPAADTYAVTLAAPSRAGIVKVIEMVATTGSNAVTLALTNVAGGSAATTASFDAAGEVLVLVSAADKWVVLAEAGVTLT